MSQKQLQVQQKAEEFGRELGMELYTGDLDDSADFDEKFKGILVPFENAEKARQEAYSQFITELPEEKNTENFFQGYNKRANQLEKFRLAIEQELNELDSEKGEHELDSKDDDF